MTRRLLSRIAGKITGMFTTIFVASLVCFAAIELPSGDYLSTYRAELQQSQYDAESIETELRYIEERFALSQPIHVRYLTWIKGLTSGDLGYSLLFRRSVNDLIGARLGNSLILAFATIVFTLVVGVGVGVFAAIRPYSIWDNALTLIVFLALAVPNFILAISFLYLWISVFGGAPQFGFHSPEFIFEPWSFAKFLDLLAHLWLPVVIVGTASAAGMVRVVRARMLEVMPEPYIQTARMKGVAERSVIMLHALRVAINPVISATALALPGMVGGELITSIVLQLNTLGPLLLQALLSQDMYLAATILLLVTVVLVVANFIADLILVWLDPRISHA